MTANLLILPRDEDDWDNLSWPIKAPGSILDYELNFTAWSILEGVNFQSVTLAASPGLHVVGQSYRAFQGKTVGLVLEIRDGTPDTTAVVDVRLNFTNGRRIDLPITLPIGSGHDTLVPVTFPGGGGGILFGNTAPVFGNTRVIFSSSATSVSAGVLFGGDTVLFGDNRVVF